MMRILHIDGKNEGKIIKFTEEMFRKCNNASDIRKQIKSKYNRIVIPHNITEDIGYHSKCYRNYTVVTADNVDSEIPTSSNISPGEMALRSSTVNSVKSINNRTGILEEKWLHICIF